MRRTFVALSVSALTLPVALAACSSNEGTSTSKDTAQKQESAISYEPADSIGPAKAPDGATKGGTIHLLYTDDFEHLDPARNYVNLQQLATSLIYRTLTTFREVPQPDGTIKSTLVGDLAQTPGTDVNKDCKVWEFKLKTGIKYEDGTAVTAKDVGYGVARSFSPDLTEGPHYLQNWLTDPVAPKVYNSDYKGPYNGGAALPPGVTVPDDQTIRFTFPKPHCDMPYGASMPTSAAVPAAKDTRADYDNRPFSSGPYKIKERRKDVATVLERNPNWDPATDPVRTQFPDTISFEFGTEAQQISERIVADAGPDQTALSWVNVVPAVLPQTQTEAVQKRVVQGPTQYVWYLNINTQRVTDLKVRQAMNLAMDKRAVVLPIGGETAGTPTTELMSPTTTGFKQYDVFGTPVTGDVAKAKSLLAGQRIKLVVAHTNTERRTAQANVFKDNLEKAGFQVVLAPIDPTTYYTEVGKKDNKYDAYLGGWGSDWPSGSTIIPPLFDGTSITPTGNQNLSYLNAPDVNAEIVRILQLPADQATAAWAALDEKIMKDYAPVVPLYTDRWYVVDGSKVGGAYMSSAFGATSLNTIFVKP